MAPADAAPSTSTGTTGTARTTGTAARREALRRRLVAEGLDALLVTEAANVRYLSGFTGSNGAVLVDVDGDDESFLATDGRYVLQAGAETPDLVLVVARAAAEGLLTDLRTATRIGFDSAQTTVDGLDALGAGDLEGGCGDLLP